MTEYKYRDMLVEMLTLQADLQATAYKHPLGDLAEVERVQFIKDMVLALTDELHEALQETTWKPWTNDRPQVNDDAFFSEIVDAWHFLMNLMLVSFPGWTPEQIASALHYRYLQKRKKNISRQRDGYSMRTNKCPGCGRALDDQYVTCEITSAEDGVGTDEVHCTVDSKTYRIGTGAPIEI